MTDDFEKQSHDVRSSGELWTEICSSLPVVNVEVAPENNGDFQDSFQPTANVRTVVIGQSDGINHDSTSVKWEPMEDSEIYIASLGTVNFMLLWTQMFSC